MAVGVAAIAAFAAIGSALSCRQIVGITDNPPEDLTSTLCGLNFGTNLCATCAQANCCAESTTCAADRTCSPYESCLGACNGDATCRSKCTIANHVPEANAAPVSALSACLASKCGSACGLTCGGFAGYLSEPDAAAGCQSCLETNACNDALTCGSSAECDAFWRCWYACVTPDCQSTCVSQHDAGVGLFEALYKDFSGTCNTPCGYGSYWACAGHVVWPNAKSSTYTWTEWAYDWYAKAGVAGAQVTVCTNCPCPNATNYVVTQGQTDDAGYISLTFQQGLSPTGQGSAYCYQTSAPGYLTNFAYGVFPGTEYGWSVHGLLPPETWGIVLIKSQSQQTEDTAIGATYDPTRSILVTGGVFDCLGSPVPAGSVDVSISTPDPSVLALQRLEGGSDALPTAQTGCGGGSYSTCFFDVPADASVTLTATATGVGETSQVSANVAPDTITQVALIPTPIP
jgi:hypothetical protein